jgi:hypothetical protein
MGSHADEPRGKLDEFVRNHQRLVDRAMLFSGILVLGGLGYALWNSNDNMASRAGDGDVMTQSTVKTRIPADRFNAEALQR